MGTVHFPGNQLWSVGSHAFWPIVDRIRAAVPEVCRPLIEPLYGGETEAYQMIVLDEYVSAATFRCFAWAARSEFERCSRSEAEARLPAVYYPVIMDCWAELVRLLEADSRWAAHPAEQSAAPDGDE